MPSPIGAFTRSAQDGTYALDGLVRGRWHLLARASDGACGGAVVYLAGDAQVETCAIELLPAAHVLRGTVRDQHGRPWGRMIGAVAPSGLAFEGGATLSTADIDAKGRFELSGLPAFDLGLALEGEGLHRVAVFGVLLPREVPLEVSVRVPETELAIQVVEARGGAPVAGAHVRAIWSCGDMTLASNQGTTDAMGNVKVPLVTPSELHVHADGYAPRTVTAPEGAASFKVELRRASRVVGRVLRADTREGVAGVGVEVSDPLSRAVVTDALGRYAIEGVPPGSWRIEARGPGWVSLGVLGARDEAWDPLAIEVADGVEVEHDVFVEAAARIEGRVLDPAGLPVAGASVAVQARGMGEGNLWRGPPRSPPTRSAATRSRGCRPRPPWPWSPRRPDTAG
jgi:hypothetical protein